MCLFQKTRVRSHTTALLFLCPARFIPEVRHLGRSYYLTWVAELTLTTYVTAYLRQIATGLSN